VPQRAMIGLGLSGDREQVCSWGRYLAHQLTGPGQRADRWEVAALLERLGLTSYARRIFAKLLAEATASWRLSLKTAETRCLCRQRVGEMPPDGVSPRRSRSAATLPAIGACGQGQ